MKRNIIKINEEKCNGCGKCVSACAEGAIQMVDGKAKLISENYCDGLGACLGDCPQGAITIEEREADEFDEEAVKKHLAKKEKAVPPKFSPKSGGCPGLAAFSIKKTADPAKKPAASGMDSELRQWPIQLHLVPVTAPYWQGADLLISADCVPFAYADFHSELLKGKKLINACTKLDNTAPYLEKLTGILKENEIRSITVVQMEVPCCNGITMLVSEALKSSGKDIPLQMVKISISGEILEEKKLN
jgi:NAD-dependent dihydropyrimidine dehydrogenase PreA subunit